MLHPPLTDAFVFRGIDHVSAVLDAAFLSVDGFRVHTRLPGDGAGVVVFAGLVAGRAMQEMHLLRIVGTGRVEDVTLMAGPYRRCSTSWPPSPAPWPSAA